MEKNFGKIAVLLLVHKNLPQVKRLIERLTHEDVYVFVHVDAKTHFGDDEKAMLDLLPNTYISEKRISASLDHWSLCEASLTLVRMAQEIEKEIGVHFSYYFNMSGQDYLIKPINHIVETLSHDYPKCHIDCVPCIKTNGSKTTWLYKKFLHTTLENRVIRFINKNMKRGYFRSAVKLPFKVLFWCVKKVTNHYKDFRKLGCILYGGSAWWILSDNAIEYIINFDSSNSKIMRIFRETETPEETFFQTITMRSPFSVNVEVNHSDERQNCLTYANFTGNGKPFVGHPYIIGSDDFEWLMKLPVFAARKFDETVDSKILDMIDNSILKQYDVR